MNEFKAWLNESVLPAIQQALEILEGHKDRQKLVNRIQELDPYPDKRFAPVMATWVRDHKVTPDEHAEDVVEFKALHRRLKDLRVPTNNPQRSSKVRFLLSRKPEEFNHYAHLQTWNREVSEILDPEKDLSDEGLPVEMRYSGYTMYRIDTEEHCQAPLIKNTMSWCVTKRSFGKYGGPPYYPVVRNRDMKPFAMIIPAYFDTDPDQAIRNAENTGRLSVTDLNTIRPLVQHVLPFYKYRSYYKYVVHDLKPEEELSDVLKIMDKYDIQPGEWPEGERAIGQDPKYAFLYAKIKKGRFLLGEKAISQNPRYARYYAELVIKGPWEPGEQTISQSAEYSYEYAKFVIDGPWKPGEEAISQSAKWSYYYAVEVIQGAFPLGEKAMKEHPVYSKIYGDFVDKKSDVADDWIAS